MMELGDIWSFFKKVGYMFYIVNPKEHLYETVDQVPDYYKEVTPPFILVIALEILLRLLRGKPLLRINDTITNVCQGILVEIFKIPLHGVELIVYMWIYDNYRLTTLPWDSVWTWLLGMVGADFFFYWMHRATHQISFLWNFHEAHHSSEDYNMTVPLRISIATSANFWYTYFPLAFAIPPQVFLVHYQMVIIFQFWLHSELYPSMGPLEWIFNTPGFHRVHHGRNRRCIDKNFGSIFIVWDRMFGTFEPESDDDIRYGVTTPIRTFNPVRIQTNFFWSMCEKFLAMKGIKNKIFALIKGPGWSPGKPWLGHLEDIPEPSPDSEKYVHNPDIPFWMKGYALLHCGALVITYLQLIFRISELPRLTAFSVSLFITVSTIAFGAIFDGRSWVPVMEIARCLLYFAVKAVVVSQIEDLPLVTDLTFKAFNLLFLGSSVLWLVMSPNVTFKIGQQMKLHAK